MKPFRFAWNGAVFNKQDTLVFISAIAIIITAIIACIVIMTI